MGNVTEAVMAIVEAAKGKQGDTTSRWLLGQANTATSEAIRERMSHDPRLRRDPMARVTLMDRVCATYATMRDIAHKSVESYETQRKSLLEAQELSEVTCTAKMLEALRFTSKAAKPLAMPNEIDVIEEAIAQVERERRETSGTSKYALKLALDAAIYESRLSRVNRWPLLGSKRLYDDDDGQDGPELLRAVDDAFAEALVDGNKTVSNTAIVAMRQTMLLGRLMDETIPKAENADGRDRATEDVDSYAINQARQSLEAMLGRLGATCENLARTRITTEMARSTWRCALSAHDAISQRLVIACEAEDQ